MAFHYDAKTSGVADDKTGISVRIKGRSEVGETPFVFCDPSATVGSWRGAGQFPFVAKDIYDVSQTKLPDDSVKTDVRMLGYTINRRVFENSFASYTKRDPKKVAELRALIVAALREYLRGVDATSDAVVVFQ
jgi:hypothetical protein